MPTVKTPAEHFTGDVYLTPIFSGDGTSRLVVGLVRFTPGARTNWHSHANGQLLVCTEGVGLVVTRDGTAIRLRAGETVWTPAGEEHWHGGTADNMMCHYAILDETPAGDACLGEPGGGGVAGVGPGRGPGAAGPLGRTDQRRDGLAADLAGVGVVGDAVQRVERPCQMAEERS